MKRNSLLVLLTVLCTVCFAQKFDGDWKGKLMVDSPTRNTPEYIFHIIGNDCSEELVRRSSNELQEDMIKMSVEGDSITLHTRKGGVFKGTLENGKIVGEYKNSAAQSYRLVLSKFGNGTINSEKSFEIDKKRGRIIFY